MVRIGIILAIIGWLIGGVVAPAEAAQQDSVIVLQVDGLACPFCAFGLEKKLQKLKGVERVDIRLNDGQVLLFIHPGEQVRHADIERKVSEAGFTLRGIKGGSGQLPFKGSRTLKIRFAENICRNCEKKIQLALEHLGCVNNVEIHQRQKEVVLTCEDRYQPLSVFKAVLESTGLKVEDIHVIRPRK